MRRLGICDPESQQTSGLMAPDGRLFLNIWPVYDGLTEGVEHANVSANGAGPIKAIEIWDN
jgi:hypothetical protein